MTDELSKLRAERDGWRQIAAHLLGGDFGDMPPVEFIRDEFPLPFDKDDRTPELLDELRRREPYITGVENYTYGGRVHVSASLGQGGSIQILRNPETSNAYHLSMYHYRAADQTYGMSMSSEAHLIPNREVSFELLLRYLDLVIAGYRASQLDEQDAL